MQCDYCQNKATVYFTQIIDGKSKKSSLCGKCAAAQGVTDPEAFLLENVSTSSSNSQKPVQNVPSIDQLMQKHGQCPLCNFAFDDLKKTGRLGCSECYQFFRREIQQNLHSMHKDVKHTGRIPEGMLENIQLKKQREELQRDLDKAISSEDYEKAAVLRDQLNQLSKTESPTEKSSLK
ncbi:MAG: UvrB/UvrC motif-containing protein [Akkermansiaceae bacterium]